MADVLKILMAERERLDRVIALLQGGTPRRGRAPGSGKKATKKAPRKRSFSPQARKKQSERMKAYWVARRIAAKKKSK